MSGPFLINSLMTLLACCSLLVLSSCGSSSGVRTGETEALSAIAAAQNQGLAVNEQVGRGLAAYRQAANLRPLSRSAGLDRLALRNSQEMLTETKLKHLAETDGRAEMAGYIDCHEALGRVGNAQKGQVAPLVFKSWIHSRNHRLILEAISTHYGIGVSQSERGYHIVLLTGTDERGKRRNAPPSHPR